MYIYTLYYIVYIYIFLFLFVHFFTSLGTGTPKSLTEKKVWHFDLWGGSGGNCNKPLVWNLLDVFLLFFFFSYFSLLNDWFLKVVTFPLHHFLQNPFTSNPFETCQVSFLRRCVKFWNLELVCLVWLLASPQLWPCCRLFIRPLSLAWDRAPAWALAAIPSMAVGPRDSPRAARAWDFGKPPFFFWKPFEVGKKERFVGWDVLFFPVFFSIIFLSTCFVSDKKVFHRSSDFHQIFLSISTILHRS